MKPYGKVKRRATIHGHNDCGICSSFIPTRGSARQQNKKLIQNELELYTFVDWDHFNDKLAEIYNQECPEFEIFS